MASLLDIGPLTASVTVRGKDISLSGIGADTLVQLLNDYPDLRKYMSGLSGDVNATAMLQRAPDIADVILLAGAGLRNNDEKAVAIVKSLTIGEKVVMLEPIMAMTFPKGFPAFVEALSRIAGEQVDGGADASGKALDTK
jgi:hypothetical protein